MSGSVADDMIRSYFERWQRLEEEKSALSDDLKELFAEARGNGLDTKALRAVFREQVGDKNALQEFDAICDLYRSSLNAPRAGRARESQSYAEAKGRDPATPKASNSKASSAEDSETPATLTDTQEQPETASEIPTGSHDQHHELVEGPEGQLEKEPLANVDAVASVSATLSNPQPTSSPAIADSPASTSSPEPGSLSDADVPAFLKPEQRKTSADYRPECKHPDNCGSSNPTGYCYQCRRAMEAASETEAA